MIKAAGFVLPGAFSSSPRNTPYVEDPDWPARWTLEAASLALADGDPVSEWLASGDAPRADRCFHLKGSSWRFPVFVAGAGPGGIPAVVFDGNSAIGNLVGSTGTPESSPQPLAYAGVFKVDNWGGNGCSASRIIGSRGLPGLISLRPGSGESPVSSMRPPGLKVQIGRAMNVVDTGWIPSDWFSLVMALNGPESYICITGQEPLQFGSPNTSQRYAGIALGASAANPGTANGAGLVGGVIELRRYTRPFSRGGVRALVQALDKKYGL